MLHVVPAIAHFLRALCTSDIQCKKEFELHILKERIIILDTVDRA